MSGKRGNNEGSVFKRTDGRWTGSVSLGNAKRKSFYGKTRAEVSQKLTLALKALNEGQPPLDGRTTVQQLLRSWLTDSAAHKVRPKSLRRYREIVELHLIPAVGKIRLAELHPQHVDRMLNAQLAAGCAPQSVHHHRAVLRTALNAGIRWGFLSTNAAAFSEPPYVPGREVHILSLADAKQFLSAIEGSPLEALFAVTLALGLRQSEGLALQWGDVDLDGQTIAIRRTIQRIDGAFVFMEPKTKRSQRVLPIPEPIVAKLRQHRARQNEERLLAGSAWAGEQWGNLVFCNEIGEPLSAFQARRRFQAILQRAGLPPLRYHDLRHGAASLMAAQGVPPRVAMELLGHSTIATTMNVYSHVVAEAQKEAVERVSGTLWGAL